MSKWSYQDMCKREWILFWNKEYDESNYNLGGIRYFDDASPSQIRHLLEAKLMNGNDKQNLAPCARAMLKFCEKHANEAEWYLHGYAVSWNREDCRVSIEGICTHKPVYDEKLIKEFRKFAKYADDCTAVLGEPLYCWYD